MQALFFIGMPGAGKSTFYHSRYFDTHLRINLDMLRTRHREGILMRACLDSKTRFVWDNTNASRRDREEMIRQARQAQFEVVAFYFEPDFESSARRNAGRSGKARVADVGLRSVASRLEKPRWEEGFSSIFSVWNLNEAGFRVEEWPREQEMNL